MSAALENVSRRQVLRGLVGTGALVLGLRLLAACQAPTQRAARGGERSASAGDGQPAGAAPAAAPPPAVVEHLDFDVFLAIGTDGTVTIVSHRSEMGTGIRTTLPMVLADELEADWNRVRIEQAVGDARYGSQNTDGSRSVRDFMTRMREVGAAARQMLERAASERWQVAASECRARLHTVVHGPSGRSLGFGELAAAAAALSVPATDELRLKPRSEWRYVGRGVPIVDLGDITTGRAVFGLDVVRPGMKYASIERPPVLGGKPKTVRTSAALAVPGVEQVVELPGFQGAPAFQALGGVAVVASSTFAALQGRRALDIEWEAGPHGSYDSEAYRRELEETARSPGRVVRERGDVAAAFAGVARVIEADYYVPHLAHASMEPPCAVAEVTSRGCEVWAPTQNPQAAQQMLARVLRMPPGRITVHVTLLGGGFGRKSKPDYVVEAALLAQQVQAPVQVVWTREDDIRHDYLHAVAAVHMQAGLDADGRVTGWLQRSVFPSISTTFDPGVRQGSDGELGLGFTDVPFDVPALRVENGDAEAHVRIGWLRSVANIYHAFAVCSFADEVAVAAGRDPLESLLELIGKPRLLDPGEEGARYSNYDQPLATYPIDTGRLRRVIELVAQRAEWGRPLPAGHGLGIAAHRSFLTYVANVVEVAVDAAGKVTIPRVHVVADCGLAAHPDRVRSQLEGAVVFGASLALNGEITAKDGAIVQGNFDSYPVLRSHQAPREIHVHVVDSEAPPGGVGEPGVPPVPPALCSALFAATGQRVRRLPIVAGGRFKV